MATTGWEFVGPLLVLTLMGVIAARHLLEWMNRRCVPAIAHSAFDAASSDSAFGSVLLRSGGWGDGDGPPVTVKVVSDPTQAHLVRLQLEHADIPVFLADENLVATDWFYSFAVGGVKVQVPAPFAERARALLAELEQNRYALTDEAALAEQSADCMADAGIDAGQGADVDVDPILCPNCGSADAYRDRSNSRVVGFISILLLGFLAPAPWMDRGRYVCGRCSHRWKEPPQS